MEQGQTDRQEPSNTILITGGTGTIGSALIPVLLERGYNINVLTRRRAHQSNVWAGINYYHWDTQRGIINRSALTGIKAIVHLAGYPIANFMTGGWWHKVWASRVNTMQFLYAITRFMPQPEIVITASAIGYYDDHGDEWIHEDFPRGNSPLAFLVEAWESAARLWTKRGIPVVAVRIGIVLSKKGGIFPLWKVLSQLRVLQRFSDVDPYYSWVHVSDVAEAIAWIIDSRSIFEDFEVFNLVAPHPVRFSTLVSELYSLLRSRPLIPPIPSSWSAPLLGPLTRYVRLSQRVSSQKIAQRGFSFKFTNIGEALSDLLTLK